MRKPRLSFRPLHDIVQIARRHVQGYDATWMRFVWARLPVSIAQEDPLVGATTVQAPIVRRLSGILSSEVSVDDYRVHMEEKYGTTKPTETSR